MGLSLAGGKRKTRIGTDPRNTQWANDTERFGHQQLLRMGWKPGRGLGSSIEGVKEHVKVKVKADATGLGKPGQQDQPTGLDVFQRILGKLNGNEEEVEQAIADKQRLTGLYMHFVPGGKLEGTVKDSKDMKADRKKGDKQRRKAEKTAEKVAEKAKREAKRKLRAARAAEKESKGAEPAVPTKPTDSADPAEPVEPAPQAPSARGIRATRSKYIAMKRKATADQQSLKEILMQIK